MADNYFPDEIERLLHCDEYDLLQHFDDYSYAGELDEAQAQAHAQGHAQEPLDGKEPSEA